VLVRPSRSNASRRGGEIEAQVLNPTQPMNELIHREVGGDECTRDAEDGGQGKARRLAGELPPGVAYMPKPWQPLKVLIAAISGCDAPALA
jgi:hypothetical protein